MMNVNRGGQVRHVLYGCYAGRVGLAGKLTRTEWYCVGLCGS